jgi:hypothetical protein
MIRFRRKQNPEERIIDITPKETVSIGVNSIEPTQRASPTLSIRTNVRNKKTEAISKEFEMTIKTKVSEFSAKQASMILMICNVEALRNGIDLTLYLSMEYLYSYLTKSSSIRPEEIKEERLRQTCLLTDLILSTFRGEWVDLGERIQILDQQVREAVVESNWLPDKRTYNSWLPYWTPSRWLEVKIVPLNLETNRRSVFSEPYSSYCKGYGESSSRGPKKTPYDSDLDGEGYQDPRPPEFNLLEAKAYQRIHAAIESNRVKRIQEQ